MTSYAIKQVCSFHVKAVLCVQILALEAIYGENVVVLDREDGLRSLQVLQVPSLISIAEKPIKESYFLIFLFFFYYYLFIYCADKYTS